MKLTIVYEKLKEGVKIADKSCPSGTLSECCFAAASLSYLLSINKLEKQVHVLISSKYFLRKMRTPKAIFLVWFVYAGLK